MRTKLLYLLVDTEYGLAVSGPHEDDQVRQNAIDEDRANAAPGHKAG